MSGSFTINLLILYHTTLPHNTGNVETRADRPITSPTRGSNAMRQPEPTGSHAPAGSEV